MSDIELFCIFELRKCDLQLMDIILHCLDPGHLKIKGLQDVFPAVCRFNQVSHCPATRRISGRLLSTFVSLLIYPFIFHLFSGI
jgi:hypothetical protein